MGGRVGLAPPIAIFFKDLCGFGRSQSFFVQVKGKMSIKATKGEQTNEIRMSVFVVNNYAFSL